MAPPDLGADGRARMSPPRHLWINSPYLSPRPHRTFRTRSNYMMRSYTRRMRYIMGWDSRTRPQPLLRSLVPQGLNCADCGLVPYLPVTGLCGHTRCLCCVLRSGICSCGGPMPQKLITDILVRQLIDRYIKMMYSSRGAEHRESGLTATPLPPATIGGGAFGGDRITLAVAQAGHSGNSLDDIGDITQSWLRSKELDCVLCGGLYSRPVTTPCGHTFCRYCIERALGYRWACPLCINSLEFWDLDAAKDNWFVTCALQSTGINMEVEEYVEDDSRLPIFVCTIAYPRVPCPLHVFEPRYRLMIKRCLLSKFKRFGMVTPDTEQGYASCGTILEIRDCVRLPSGQFLISTMGIARFRVEERHLLDGYDTATFKLIEDETVSSGEWRAFCETSRRLYGATCGWLQRMHWVKLAEVEATYGLMPPADDGEAPSTDGPAWIWWILALLPLSTEIKLMVLSSPLPAKRLRSITHTLHLLQSEHFRSNRYYQHIQMNFHL